MFFLFDFRHSTNPQPLDRVNKYLASALTARSVDREKRNHVNFFTLRFKESSKERRVIYYFNLIPHHYVLSSVLSSPYEFCIKTMFRSFLLPVVCRRAHVLYIIYACLHILVSNTYFVVFFALFVFVFCLLCPILPVYLIAPSQTFFMGICRCLFMNIKRTHAPLSIERSNTLTIDQWDIADFEAAGTCWYFSQNWGYEVH